MRMLMTFFNELTTQSNTAFSFGTRFIVFRGRRTRRTRSDFIMDRFCTAGLPLEKKKISLLKGIWINYLLFISIIYQHIKQIIENMLLRK